MSRRGPIGAGGAGGTGPAGPTGATGPAGPTGTIAGATISSGTVRIGDGVPLVEAALLVSRNLVAINARTAISTFHAPTGSGNGVMLMHAAVTTPATGAVSTFAAQLWAQLGPSGIELWAQGGMGPVKLAAHSFGERDPETIWFAQEDEPRFSRDRIRGP